MKKKIFSLIVILIVAICSGVFVGCGGAGNKDLSISINAGLDVQEEGVLGIGEELFLTDGELQNLKNGKAFNNTVQSGTAVSLVLGSEKYSSREIVVETKGVENAKVFFSTDSQAISISEVEYLSNGNAKVLISANSVGTAEVYVQTGEFSKKTSFVVKVFEPLKKISVKNDSVIYLERGKTVNINPSDLINFQPASSNLTEVEFWDGETRLTQNGKTVLATSETEGATGIISESKEIVVKSLRLPEGSNVQVVQVVVVDNLKELKKEKMVYEKNADGISFVENFKEIDGILTVIRNVQTDEGINYGIRRLKISAVCAENLEIVPTIFDKNGNSLNISAFPVSKTRNGNDHEFVFEFKYEGYSNYTVEFAFKTGGYSYSNRITQEVEFKTASNIIDFKKVGEDFGQDSYLIYDWYNASLGTKFAIATNKSDEIKNATISLDVSEAVGKINVLDINGNLKTLEEGTNTIFFNNNEVFYISAINGNAGSVDVDVKVSYEFENVLFETKKSITFKLMVSPKSFEFFETNNGKIDSYIFDLNTSGKIVSGFRATEDYSARNLIELSLKGYVDGIEVDGNLVDFVVVSPSDLVKVEIKNGKLVVNGTGNGTGSGNFQVVLGNGISRTFNFTVIKSVSSASAKVSEKSEGIISIIKNYSHTSGGIETIYDQFVILKTHSELSLQIVVSGGATSVKVSGNNVSYSNEKIKVSDNVTKANVDISLDFQYVNNKGEIETRTVIFQKILLTSIIEIESFKLVDAGGNEVKNLELFDFNTVGINALGTTPSTKAFFVRIDPEVLQGERLDDVVWSTNLTKEDIIAETDKASTYVLETKGFILTYNKTGANQGLVEIRCSVSDQHWLQANKDRPIKIFASLKSELEDGGTRIKTINLKIKQAEQVELISANVDEIHLDNYVDSIVISPTTYPTTATNHKVRYEFIPVEGLESSAITISVDERTNEAMIQLADSTASGKGILRIIALDSYINSNTYSVYHDIILSVDNGSSKYPFYVNNSNEIIKLVDTNFQYYYVINGEINVNEYNTSEIGKKHPWNVSENVLTGSIVGVNGAKISGITINDKTESQEKIGEKTETHVYAGLFKSISGNGIENVAFNVSFELDLGNLTVGTENSYKYVHVGGIAGKLESGSNLTNVSVEIAEGFVSVSGDYGLYFGGVVGTNSGTIKNTITKSSTNNSLVNYTNQLTISDESTSSKGHNLYVGGAVGHNAGGRIEREIEDATEFNNAFATANVDLKLEITNRPTGNVVEGIGGIVGFNETASTSIKDSEQGLFNVSACGTIYATGFDNVGGIVGNNSHIIKNAQTQVFVSGKSNVGGAVGTNGGSNVGGAVGTNSGILESIIVENLRQGDDENVLISGSNNVGGIVGNMAGGSLKSSSFISYVSAEEVDLSATGEYGMIVGAYTEGEIGYVVAVADAEAKGENEIFPTSNNFAIYSKKDHSRPRKFNLQVVAGAFNPDLSLTELKKKSGFGFIYLPIGEINVRLVDSGLQMTGSGNLAFFWFLTNETNAINEIELSRLLTTSEIRKGLVVEVAEDSNILDIEGGNLVPKGTGVAILEISSPYSSSSNAQNIYVYIVDHANSLGAYYYNTNGKVEIANSSTVEFDASENQFVYFNFLGFNTENHSSPKDIKVKIKIDGEEIVAGEDYLFGGIKLFTLIQITPTSYQIVVYEQTANLTGVEIIPYLEFSDDETKTTYLKEFLNWKISGLTLNFANYTKSVEISKSEIITEPYYTSQVDVTFDSLSTDEILAIELSVNGEKIDKDKNDIFNYLDIIVVYDGTTTQLGSSEFDEIDCKKENTLKVYFELHEDYKKIKENLNLELVFKSSNGKEATLKVVYEPQTVFSVNATLYPVKPPEESHSTGSFSYIQSGVIIPGQNSLIEFLINPAFTNFTSIEITNLQENEYNLIFDLFSREENQSITGTTAIENGISIPSDLITNGKFALRTYLDQRIGDNSNVSIQIAFKDGKEQIGETFLKTFYVEKLPGVSVTIEGVTSGSNENTEENPLKLAQGLTYDLDLWVKGYELGEFVATSSKITDGQVVFQIQGNPNLVSIVKHSDGKYELVVNDVINAGESRKVQILVYGVNQFGEKSQENTIYLEIAKFVVKTNNIGDIIGGVVNNVYASATGNSHTFEIVLNSRILIYDMKNQEIANEVEDFLNDLTVNGLWSFSENNGGWQAIKNNPNFVDSGVNKVYETKQGIFKIFHNELTQKITIRFLKTESASAPTLRLQFFGTFYYKDGVPTVGVPTGGLVNTYSLSQAISFDVSEKTTLRNPFPIYTAEQFADMREGSYYILMNPITLPSDFKPITAEIGGFDGNNHAITIPNLSIQADSSSTTLEFGLFAKTGEKSLLKNIVVEIDGGVYISLYDFSVITFGLIAAENNGKITNCRIVPKNPYSILNLNLYGETKSTSVLNNIGGLVGNNRGDITNCQLEAGIAINSVQTNIAGSLTANLGGLVATNNGSIASCYVSARVENNTVGSGGAITGGLVAENQTGATIFASYIAGEKTFPTREELAGATTVVYSTAKAGGFVHINRGEISNCFSNIPVIATDGSAGFVYNNEGTVSYSYSTSPLESSAKNGSFVGVLTGVVDDKNGEGEKSSAALNTGKLEECYSWTNPTPTDGSLGKINSGLGPNKVEGLKLVQSESFGITKGQNGYLFEKFVFSTTSLKTDGVWFWGSGEYENQFLKDGKAMSFSTLAPQLVSPNILSRGNQELKDVIYNEETKTTSYYYYVTDAKYEEGSKYNPYVIATPEDLEFMVSPQSGLTNGNIIKSIFCRLIGDIIYETSTTTSGLYQYSFLGNLEGNGYTIGNYVLDSAIAIPSAGFFASLGTLTNQTATIKNTTFAPRYISLTNSNAVGAIAGGAYGATLVNLTIDGRTYSTESEPITIIGRNVVGGVVGVVEGAFNFNNIKTDISTNSSYRASLNGHLPVEYSGIIDKSSYSGMIAGVMSGYGQITYVEVGGENVSVGEYAGLVFGHVGRNVTASTIAVKGQLGQSVKADVYCGIIAAYNAGTLINITITSPKDPAYRGFFAYEHHVPTAVGNIVGFMNSGTIKNAKVEAPMTADAGVYSVGGAVGEMISGIIEDVEIIGDITAGNRVGGIVGYVRNRGQYMINITNCSYSGNVSSKSSSNYVAVGTIIGYISDYIESDVKNKKIIIKNSGSKMENFGVNVVTYATSQAMEIWVGEVVFIKTDLKRGLWNPHPSDKNIDGYNRDYVFPEYTPTTSGWFVPLAPAVKINGDQWQLINKVWTNITATT